MATAKIGVPFAGTKYGTRDAPLHHWLSRALSWYRDAPEAAFKIRAGSETHNGSWEIDSPSDRLPCLRIAPLLEPSFEQDNLASCEQSALQQLYEKQVTPSLLHSTCVNSTLQDQFVCSQCDRFLNAHIFIWREGG